LRRREGKLNIPHSIDIRPLLDQQFHYEIIPPRRCSVEGQHPIEDGIDRLAMGEGVFDETDVAVRSGGVEIQVRDWDWNHERKKSDFGRLRGGYVQLYFDSALCVVLEGIVNGRCGQRLGYETSGRAGCTKVISEVLRNQQ